MTTSRTLFEYNQLICMRERPLARRLESSSHPYTIEILLLRLILNNRIAAALALSLFLAACGGGGSGESPAPHVTSTGGGPSPVTETGTALLSWMPPTQNVDGSTLTNLAGYEVLYGRSPDDLSQKVTLSNPGLSSYVVENLSSGTWYFTVVALNSDGVSSPLSNLASKTIS